MLWLRFFKDISDLLSGIDLCVISEDLIMIELILVWFLHCRLTVTDSDGATNSTVANVTVIKGKSLCSRYLSFNEILINITLIDKYLT